MRDDEPTPSGRRPRPGRLPNMECAKNRVKQSHVHLIVARVSRNSLKPEKLPDGTAPCTHRPRIAPVRGLHGIVWGSGAGPPHCVMLMTIGQTGSNGADITAYSRNWEGDPLSPRRSA